ncbi:MAG: RsmD family RNA methyltransferase, partial [Alphaproteobacteria bacterium]|nr:RsmD family RNA methyltransferase [Alphaproteobacteria bacterium]
MRIIGGTWRGKKLADLQGDQTRPTSDRARESLFNLLDNHLRRTGQGWND